MEIGEATGCLIAHGGAAWLSTCCRWGGGASSAEELLLAQCGSCCPAVLPRAPALTHSASAVTRAQPERCHPPPLLPLQTKNKGSLSPNPHFERGEACRAPPALVSRGLREMTSELRCGGMDGTQLLCGMFESLLHTGRCEVLQMFVAALFCIILRCCICLMQQKAHLNTVWWQN